MRFANALLLTLFASAAAACTGNTTDVASDDSALTSKVDAVGCGDGRRSEPNGWFMTLAKDNSPLFQALTLMTSNLFAVSDVTPENPATDSGSLAFPEAVSQVTGLSFVVTFTPAANPLNADSIANRDKVLQQLKGLGATIECDNILPRPGTSVGSNNGAPLPVDAAGCGDGTTSAPNSWFVEIKASSTPLFKQLVLLSSNLMSIESMSADNSETNAGSLAFPEDVSKVTDIIVEETFTPAAGANLAPSIKNRNHVLRELKGEGVKIECDNILPRH